MSYAGFRSNELLVYLKPYSVPPYKTVQCAKWLVEKGKFRNVNAALDYITYLEVNKPQTFKHLMSEFYRITDYKGQYLVFNEHVNDIATPEEIYGQEPHMYF